MDELDAKKLKELAGTLEEAAECPSGGCPCELPKPCPPPPCPLPPPPPCPCQQPKPCDCCPQPCCPPPPPPPAEDPPKCECDDPKPSVFEGTCPNMRQQEDCKIKEMMAAVQKEKDMLESQAEHELFREEEALYKQLLQMRCQERNREISSEVATQTQLNSYHK